MRKHPLPGINRKIDAHKKEVAAEFLAGSSAFQYRSPFKQDNNDPNTPPSNMSAPTHEEFNFGHLRRKPNPTVHAEGSGLYPNPDEPPSPVNLKVRSTDEFGNIKGTSAYEALEVEKKSPLERYYKPMYSGTPSRGRGWRGSAKGAAW